ncbi:DegT/DnrJ/EryC1/StrS family aminotransferase [Shewanella morhuae]|uniref:UDP-4-amino-4-deoxy-L-arabinose--oxoglutarate aminotransferase n=1 Tax=Shewanella morhuae TaxID=365591 RepID=A0A380A6T9_9GAMM|nr:DegT/DnrJ/EryC1/StrS family aminotransferase [Shewanella morhuae]SUI75375.1 UDP-4-amino-4-deoxy-L-arabinose--oxoglutarate aminotransferase [Shewanella morhuae]
MIKYPIVRPVLPKLETYQQYISTVFDNVWLTNMGPLHQQLEQRLAAYLGVKHLMLVSNGTLALQVAYKALELGEHILTTPFSFAATASSLAWQNHQCYFVDIDADSLNIDPDKISDDLAERCDGIVATHVFGNPCDVEKLDRLSKKYQLKIIYDAAHAFNCHYQGQSILNWGDASTLSLHATKIFHTVEGGAIIFKREADLIRARQLINFGFNSQQFPEFIGINAKLNEINAAMGLALLDGVEEQQQLRIRCVERYRTELVNLFQFQTWRRDSDNNGAYMPIICDSEEQLLSVMKRLTTLGVQTRRYFYPSLAEVPCYGMRGDTPIASDISRRILCLPLYAGMNVDEVTAICKLIKQAVAESR